MKDNLIYKLNSGKPIKAFSFIAGFVKGLVPTAYYRHKLAQRLAKAKGRSDYEYILERVNYYLKGNAPFSVPKDNQYKQAPGWILYTGEIGKYTRKLFHTAYYLDQKEVTRWFPPTLRWSFCPGDVYFTPESPTIVKSRLLSSDNGNSVVLKLDKLRHFMFVHDPFEWGG